jgi:hypothetical protein
MGGVSNKTTSHITQVLDFTQVKFYYCRTRQSAGYSTVISHGIARVIKGLICYALESDSWSWGQCSITAPACSIVNMAQILHLKGLTSWGCFWKRSSVPGNWTDPLIMWLMLYQCTTMLPCVYGPNPSSQGAHIMGLLLKGSAAPRTTGSPTIICNYSCTSLWQGTIFKPQRLW